MKMKPAALSAILIAFLLGGILFSDMLGLWITESSKEPAKYTSGENAGQYNPADIRGSYSFGDINSTFNIPLEDLGTAFGVTDNVAAFQCKGLESAYSDAAASGYEIGTDSVRLFVAMYLNLPYQPEDTYLPASAVEVLKKEKKLSAEQLAYLEKHTYPASRANDTLPSDSQAPSSADTVQVPSVKPAEPSGQTAQIVQPEPLPSQAEQAAQPEQSPAQDIQPSPAAEHTTASEDKQVKGKTTFNELLDWGVSKEAIEEILGKPFSTGAMTVRDFCSKEGIEFSDVKAQLQAIIDKQ